MRIVLSNVNLGKVSEVLQRLLALVLATFVDLLEKVVCTDFDGAVTVVNVAVV